MRAPVSSSPPLPRLPRAVAVVRCRWANAFGPSCHSARTPPPRPRNISRRVRGAGARSKGPKPSHGWDSQASVKPAFSGESPRIRDTPTPVSRLSPRPEKGRRGATPQQRAAHRRRRCGQGFDAHRPSADEAPRLQGNTRRIGRRYSCAPILSASRVTTYYGQWLSLFLRQAQAQELGSNAHRGLSSRLLSPIVDICSPPRSSAPPCPGRDLLDDRSPGDVA